MVREDLNENLSLVDLTPTVKRFNHGLGDETPRTIVLGLLKDAEGPLTIKELHAALGGRLEGQGAREKVGERAVRRWVEAWCSSGLVEEAPARRTGQRGRPSPGYQVAGGSLYEADLSKTPPTFFETPSAAGAPEDGVFDTAMSKTPDVKNPEDNAGVVSPVTPRTDLFPGYGLTQDEPDPFSGAPQEGPGGFGHADAMSKTSEAETQLPPGVSEEGPEVFDTERGIRRGDQPAWGDPEWDAIDWGRRHDPVSIASTHFSVQS